MDFSAVKVPIEFTRQDIHDIIATGSSKGDAKVYHLWAYWHARYGRSDHRFAEEHLSHCDPAQRAEVLGHIHQYEISLRAPIRFRTESGDPEHPVYNSVTIVQSYDQPLIDADELVIPEQKIIVLIDYPLEIPTEVVLQSVGGFTRQGLLDRIRNAYETIYQEEERTSTKPVETVGDYCTRWLSEHPEATEEDRRHYEFRSALMNRASTNGIYGIYGHELRDLALVEVKYHQGHYTLVVDS